MATGITFREKGYFSKVTKLFKDLSEIRFGSALDRCCQKGVEALAAATPKDTGKTANSWDYRIEYSKSSITISFINRNINNGVNVAVILQYGHGTNNGGYVEGLDYINPAMKPIFEEIANEAWKEVANR